MENFEKHYYSLNEYLHKSFGTKVYKLALNAPVNCPNRDGKIGEGGCIFCCDGGANGFSPSKEQDIEEQIDIAKRIVSSKLKNKKDVKYIAYFQSYSNTYGDIYELEKLYKKVLSFDDIVAISIATRPDCLSDEVLSMLKSLKEIKPVWVELGLQTIHEKTAEFIRRGYDLSVYNKAISKLKEIGAEIIVHLILGLPGETNKMMLQSVKYVSSMDIQGIKLHLLHVLKGTDLENIYNKGAFEIMSLNDYCEILGECIKIIPKNIVIHRLTGDGAKKFLIAPKWSADKKNVLNSIHRYFKEKGIYQGTI